MHGGYANFYSRPCGRGDEADVCGRNAVIISTHAPAGGATAKPGYGVQGHHISTHAPAGGATSPEDAASRSAPLFLLTPLREGRPQAGRRRHHGHRISTHAPAGGATRWPRRSARR